MLVIIYFFVAYAHAIRLHPKLFSSSRILSLPGNVNDIRNHKYSITSSSLLFKVAEEAEVDTDQDDGALDFVSGPPSSKKSSVFKKLSKGVVPIAASLGFAVTPSTAVASRIAGAAAGGLAGYLMKKGVLDRLFASNDNDDDANKRDGGGGGSKYINTEVEKALRAIEKTIDANLDTINLATIEAIARQNKVSEENLKVFFAYIFAKAALQATSSLDEDLLDLGNLIEFSDSVQFTEAEVGEGFTLASSQLSKLLERDASGFFSSDYSSDLLLQAAKLFFISDKMIQQYRGYYGSRVDTGLSYFTPEMFSEIITKACKNMFQNFIQNVLLDASSFTKEEMDIYQSFLSVSPHVSEFRPANMMDLIRESVQYTLDQSLLPNATAPIDFQALEQAKNVFGWSSYEFGATIEAKTLPVFEVKANKIFHDVLENLEVTEQKADELFALKESLNIDTRKARAYLLTLISHENARYMDEIQKVYDVAGANVEPAFKIMTSYAKTWDALKVLTDKIMVDTEIPIPGLPFAQMVRVSLYQMQLTKQKMGQSTGLKDDMFVLNKEQQNIVKKTMALPKVSSWIGQCISEGQFNENAKAAYKKQLQEYGVTDQEWAATSVDFYYQELQKIAQSRAVPSDGDMKRMAAIAEFLDCPSSLVSKVSMELLGDKYVKAVSEAMTPTGVIVEEYKDGLERLKNRLQLTSQDTKTLLGVAARNRMIPVIKDLVDIFKSDTDLTGRRKKERENSKKDKSSDPISNQDSVLGYMEMGGIKEGGGPNVFMREALNLVNFFSENYLNDGEGTVIEDLESMPVNAVGVVPQDDLIGAYKHYLVTMLSEPNEDLRQRYADDERVFGMVIGVAKSSQQKVKESLMYTAYKNMLSNILRVKDAVETSDLQQFALLKDRLSLDAETGERILSEATKGAVLEYAAKMIRSETTTITADVARRFRLQVSRHFFIFQ